MAGRNAERAEGQADQDAFSETLKDDGSLYMDNLRGAHVTDIYTPASDGLFSWEPRFTYHGFRFVEITGLNYKPELKKFQRESQLRPDGNGRFVRVVRFDDQPDLPQCVLGYSRQLPQYADRLSAARRAYGMARRPRDGVASAKVSCSVMRCFTKSG